MKRQGGRVEDRRAATGLRNRGRPDGAPDRTERGAPRVRRSTLGRERGTAAGGGALDRRVRRRADREGPLDRGRGRGGAGAAQLRSGPRGGRGGCGLGDRGVVEDVAVKRKVF